MSPGEGVGPGQPLPSPGASAEACLSPPGVLSKEQIRKKKIRKQQQQQQQQSSPMGLGVSSSSPASGPGASPGGSDGGGQGSGEGEGVQLTAAQELMIQQLVAAQLQCNKRSFSDQPKVTVRPLPQLRGTIHPVCSSRQGHSPGHRERMRLQRTGTLRRGSLGLAGDVLRVTCSPPHPRVPSPGPWVQTRSPVMPASSVSPTSRSWPSSPCRRSWTLPSRCLASCSWVAKTRSPS